MSSGIQWADSLKLNRKKPLDAAYLMNTLAELKADPYAYDGKMAFVKEDGKNYRYGSLNEEDITTGKWRVFGEIQQSTFIVPQIPATREPAVTYYVETPVYTIFKSYQNGGNIIYLDKEISEGTVSEEVDIYLYDSTNNEMILQIYKGEAQYPTGGSNIVIINSVNYSRYDTEDKRLQTDLYYTIYFCDSNLNLAKLGVTSGNILTREEVIKLIKGTEKQNDYITQLYNNTWNKSNVQFASGFNNYLRSGELFNYIHVKVIRNDGELKSTRKKILELPEGTFNGDNILRLIYKPATKFTCEEDRHYWHDIDGEGYKDAHTETLSSTAKNLKVDENGYATQLVSEVNGELVWRNGSNNTYPECDFEQVIIDNSEKTINVLSMPAIPLASTILYRFKQCFFKEADTPEENIITHNIASGKWYYGLTEITVNNVSTLPKASESTLNKFYLYNSMLYIGINYTTYKYATTTITVKKNNEFRKYTLFQKAGVTVNEEGKVGRYWAQPSVQAQQISDVGVFYDGTYGFIETINDDPVETLINVQLEDNSIYVNGDTSFQYFILMGDV